MTHIQSCSYSNRELCNKIFKIRSEVFVNEQKVDRTEEFDEFENTSIHYLGSLNNEPAGTARWRITENGIKLERFAVLPQFRNKGVAAAILKNVLNDVKGAQVKIYLHAQITAVAFYEKYGFIKEGPLFSEANIDHYKMSFNK